MREENFQGFLTALKKRKCDGTTHSPLQLMMGLTNVCNLHCAFCPYCGFCMQKIEKMEEMSLELITQMKPYLENACFINPSVRGEPLLYSNLERFIEVCRECDCLDVLQLINNGTQLHRFKPEIFEGINVICVSVDSVNKETFELLRSGASFEKVMDNVKNLRESLKDAVLQWNVVVNRLNIRELYDIFLKAREMGINYISFNDIYGFEEDKTIQLLRLRKSDYKVIDEQFDKINVANKDNEMFVANLISYDRFEDNVICDPIEIKKELLKLKGEDPYLDFDEINVEDTESRKTLARDGYRYNVDKFVLPYCTQPFSTMVVYPNLNIAPCCADFGALDQVGGGKDSL